MSAIIKSSEQQREAERTHRAKALRALMELAMDSHAEILTASDPEAFMRQRVSRLRTAMEAVQQGLGLEVEHRPDAPPSPAWVFVLGSESRAWKDYPALIHGPCWIFEANAPFSGGPLSMHVDPKKNQWIARKHNSRRQLEAGGTGSTWIEALSDTFHADMTRTILALSGVQC